MSQIMDFATWFLSAIPDFLMSEPICYLFGLFLLGLVINIFMRLVFWK